VITPTISILKNFSMRLKHSLEDKRILSVIYSYFHENVCEQKKPLGIKRESAAYLLLQFTCHFYNINFFSTVVYFQAARDVSFVENNLGKNCSFYVCVKGFQVIFRK